MNIRRILRHLPWALVAALGIALAVVLASPAQPPASSSSRTAAAPAWSPAVAAAAKQAGEVPVNQVRTERVYSLKFGFSAAFPFATQQSLGRMTFAYHSLYNGRERITNYTSQNMWGVRNGVRVYCTRQSDPTCPATNNDEYDVDAFVDNNPQVPLAKNIDDCANKPVTDLKSIRFAGTAALMVTCKYANGGDHIEIVFRHAGYIFLVTAENFGDQPFFTNAFFRSFKLVTPY
jgi:hypothetical protein